MGSVETFKVSNRRVYIGSSTIINYTEVNN